MTNMEFEERIVEESRASPQTHPLTANPEKFDNYQPASCNMNTAEAIKNNPILCASCQKPIYDQYYMWVDQRSFHESCVQCNVCNSTLTESCFAKNHKLYCPQDYKQLQKCHRCSKLIPLNEFVLNVSGQPYHVTCFACDVCHQALQSGDQYHVNEMTNQISCKACHNQTSFVIGSSVDPDMELASDSETDDELFSRQSMSMSDISFLSGYGGANDMYSGQMMLPGTNGKISMSPMTPCSDGKRIKRPRTILTTAQRRKFKASFEVSQKPCRKVRETLAAETGLSPRVVQVWFQNQRAKVKKIARRHQSDGHHSQNGRRSRRKKTLDSDSDNELSSPASYVSMPAALHTSYYHETFRSPGSIQTSPTTSVPEASSYNQFTPNMHDSTSEFLYEDFDNTIFSGGEAFVTSSTPTTTSHLAKVNLDTRHQGDQMGTLSRPASDYNINGTSSYYNPPLDGDLLSESSPQDVFPQFGTLQSLSSFPNHTQSEGNPIDRLMCMQSTFFRT